MNRDPTPTSGGPATASDQPKTRWIADVQNSEIVAFGLWMFAEFALAFAGTLVIVHRAVKLPLGAHLSNSYLVTWAATWSGSMLLLSSLAGALVFRRHAPWDVLLTWPWLVGFAVGIGSFSALTGQMEGGSRLCTLPHGDSCDTSWGIGAMFLSLAAAIALGGAFIGVASLKRFTLRLLALR